MVVYESGPRSRRFGPAAGAAVLELLEVSLISSEVGVEVGVSQFCPGLFFFFFFVPLFFI